MKTIGIIAEYNPFHNGHLYQINKIKEKYPDSIIIVCLTASFTQRGEVSILNKWEKTQIALQNNVDIVIELPYIYAVQSSDIFAESSLKLLNELKIEELCFGSENNNLDNLIKCAKTELYNKEFDIKVKEYMQEGISYPTALNRTLKDLINIEILEPNDLLALSYLKSIYKNNYKIKPFIIKRTNNYHDLESNENIISASNIRNKIKNDIDIKNNVPLATYQILKNKTIQNKYFNYLKYKIISEQNLDKYVDVEEGINNRIKKYIYSSSSLEELIQNIKTKRYTYNKISRMLNHILCSFTKDENSLFKTPEYIRILGFSNNGQKHLSSIKSTLNLPILNVYDTTKYKSLEIEKRVTDIYSIIYEDITLKEIQNKPIQIKTEN